MDLFSIVEKEFGNDSTLRVLTDLYSSNRFSLNAYNKAKIILQILKKINTLNSKDDSGWKQKWVNSANLSTKPSGVKEWFYGRASISFKAILALKEFSSKEDFELILNNCSYFCTKTSSPAMFPRAFSPDLTWLVAALLCDGHLYPNGSGLAFEVGDLTLAKVFSSKINAVFEAKCMGIREINRVGRNTTYVFDLSNKPVCHFFNKIFEVPFGKKCAIIGVPKLIQQADIETKKVFLKGVFDTDGGKRGGGLGLTSLSERFVDNVSELLQEFGIAPHNESWINKKYQKKCFGSRFKIDANSMFLVRSKGMPFDSFKSLKDF